MRRAVPCPARLAALVCSTLIASCALLAGCAPDDAGSQGKTRIRFSGYTGNPAETDLVSQLVAEFNASNPDLDVVYEPVPGQYYPKILTMLVANTAPDVFYLDVLYARPFLAKRILRPLDQDMTRSGLRRDQFIPALYDAFTEGDSIYGVPKDFNSLALFYNQDIFDRWRVASPDSSWTLDTLRQVSRQLVRGGAPPHGFALTHDDADRYLPVARMFGANLFDVAGRCALDSPEARRALDYYAGLELADRSAIHPSEVGTTKPYDVFGRGLAAMVFEGGWAIPYLREMYPRMRYGVAELPAGPAGRSNFLFTVAYVIPRTSRHPDAAWRLIEFLTSEAVQERITFALPSRRRVAERYVERHPAYRPILDAAAYAVPYEFGPKGDRVRERLGTMVQEVFLGAKDVAGALHDAARDIDQINRL
jgi:multiple sugar transport system substrate-binding protein